MAQRGTWWLWGPADTRATGAAAEAKVAQPWLMAAVGLIVYGCLIPFHFPFGGNTAGWFAPWGLRLTFLHGGAMDTALNVALYAPVGFIMLWGYGSRTTVWGRRLVWATCLAAGLSFALELGQSWTLARIGSWNDVRCNVMGCAVGAVAAILLERTQPSWRNWLEDWARRRPWDGAALALSCGLLAYHLLPFDLVHGTADLRNSFRQAQWTLLLPRVPDAGAPPLAAVAHQLLAAAWFAALGFLLVRAALMASLRRMETVLRVLVHGVGLAAVVELLQLFSRVHVFDVASMALRMLAVLGGGWIAWWTRLRPREVILSLLPPLAAGCAILLIAFAVIGQARHVPSRAALSELHVHDWPLESLWRLPAGYAALEAAEAWVVYAPLTLFLATALGLCGRVPPKAVVMVTVFAAALLVEIARALTAGDGRVDLSDPLLAAMATWITLHVISQFPIHRDHRR